jgi:hypothetical protein
MAVSKSGAARLLGKLGGRKGGPARARALGGTQRKQIASHAAKSRWGKPTSYKRAATVSRKAYVKHV